MSQNIPMKQNIHMKPIQPSLTNDMILKYGFYKFYYKSQLFGSIIFIYLIIYSLLVWVVVNLNLKDIVV